MKVRVLFIFALVSLTTQAEPFPPPETVLQNYYAASQLQQNALNGASMEVQIDASLPRLKKQGRLQAWRHISRLGRITYDALRFEGDNTVKNNVIARYLTAEAQSQSDEMPSLTVTPDNYKFKYKRLVTAADGREAYVFEVNPRKKRVGLFKGEIWIDSLTYLRVQESGRLVKNPSIFLKRVEFVRKYEIREGIAVPLEVQSVVETRLVGRAEMNIQFSKYSPLEAATRASLDDTEDQ